MAETKKKLLDELKKYNKALDQHVSKVDVDLINHSLKNSTPNEQTKEFQTLFSQNLLDLRTEVALLRKNLSVDIESMVLKVVNTQHNEFSDRMNNLFLQTTHDMKTYLNGTLEKFGEEMTQIRKSYNEMSVQNSNLKSEVTKLTDELQFLKDQMIESNSQNSHLEIQRKLTDLGNLLSVSTKQIFERNEILDQNLNKLNNSISKFPKQPQKIAISSTKKISSPEIEIIPESTLEPLPDHILKTEKDEQLPIKILDIDSRLKKLNSLK